MEAVLFVAVTFAYRQAVEAKVLAPQEHVPERSEAMKHSDPNVALSAGSCAIRVTPKSNINFTRTFLRFYWACPFTQLTLLVS